MSGKTGTPYFVFFAENEKTVKNEVDLSMNLMFQSTSGLSQKDKPVHYTLTIGE
jgi:hypothetical protein